MLNAPDIPPSFKFYALMHCAHTYRLCPTAANKMDPGLGPNASLGIAGGLQDLVPFGNPCTYKAEKTSKGDIGGAAGRIIGYAVDTPGYVVVLEDADGKVTNDCTIVSSVHVVPSRGNRPWVPDGSGSSSPPPPTGISTDYVSLPTPDEARAREPQSPTPGPTKRRVTVGTVPGGLREPFFPAVQRSRSLGPALGSAEDPH